MQKNDFFFFWYILMYSTIFNIKVIQRVICKFIEVIQWPWYNAMFKGEVFVRSNYFTKLINIVHLYAVHSTQVKGYSKKRLPMQSKVHK